MAKRIVAKTGEYQKDGATKGEYTKLGVILSNDNGEYMLLDPCVSLGGVLVKQNALAAKSGGQQRDMVMVSIFEDDNQQQAPAQPAYQQQAPAQPAFDSNQQNANVNPNGGYQQAPQQGGFQQNPPYNPQQR